VKKAIVSCLLFAVIGGLVGFALGRKRPPSHEQVVAYLSRLSLPELVSLKEQLERDWGVTAAPSLQPAERQLR